MYSKNITLAIHNKMISIFISYTLNKPKTFNTSLKINMMKKKIVIVGSNICNNSFQDRPIFINDPSNIFLSMKSVKNTLSLLLVKKLYIFI